MINYSNTQENNITLFNNILINNGIITAYYVLFPYNYDIMDHKSIEKHVDRLYNVISNLYSLNGELKFSLFKLRNIISKEETINSIVNTIRQYKPEYNDLPDNYKKFINNMSKDFVILAINIDAKNNIDVEKQSILQIIKNAFDSSVKTVFSTNNNNIDENAIAQQNIRIKHTLQRYAVPANSKLVMNIYINSVFPSYNLIYNDYLLEHKAPILGNIKQEIIPHLGWFEMSNSGIEAFGANPRITYGSILTILEFPDAINSQNFNIALPGLHVNINALEKNKALLKFKRMRADIDEELNEVDQTGDIDSDIDKHSQMAQYAINNIKQGRIAADIDANFLVLADSEEELSKKKKHIISVLADVGMVVSIASNQASTFINSIVKHHPKEYYHTMDLQYALSFQIDNGIDIGDGNSKFAAPVIGIG